MMRSFRDPQGHVEVSKDIVKRFVRNGAEEALFFAERLRNEFPDSIIQIIGSENYEGGCLIKHPRIPFISYPSEWSPLMLWSAGKLTIEVAIAIAKLGGRLKDASAYNILFTGTTPIFVDLLSFEKRPKGHYAWKAYEQFSSHFLRPLSLFHNHGLSTRTAFCTGAGGVPKKISFGKWAKLDPSYQSDEKATFIHIHLLKFIANRLKKPRIHPSFWTTYTETRSHYNETALAQKELFVSSFLEACKPKMLLDLGANTGEYSILAAKMGTKVVAIDSDESAIDKLFQKARDQNLSILPLVVDICYPTPASGFDYQERISFLERSNEHFDAILCLALLHHLLLKERIPLDKVVQLFSTLAPKQLLIERIGEKDPMAQNYSHISSDLFGNLNDLVFQKAFFSHFRLIRSLRLEGMDREIYWLEKC